MWFCTPKVSAFQEMRIGSVSKGNACLVSLGRLDARYESPRPQQRLPSRDPVGLGTMTTKSTVTEIPHSALNPPPPLQDLGL